MKLGINRVSSDKLQQLALSLLAAVVFVGSTTSAKAGEEELDFGNAIPLADLLANGSMSDGFVIGDKMFSDFGWVGAFDASNFSIVPFENTVNGNLGFQIRGGFIAFGGETNDQTLTYTVKVLDPLFLISDVHLDFNGFVQNGLAIVTETIKRPDNSTIGQIAVTQDSLADLMDLDPQDYASELSIEKNILVAANAGGGNFSHISIITQEFSQTQIPEPSTVVLVGAGLVGLCVTSRRRK